MTNSEANIYVWKPVSDSLSTENLKGKFYIRSTSFDCDGFKIVLNKDTVPQKAILINFSGAAYSYRITEKTLSLHLLKAHAIVKKEEQSSAWAFFKLENSEYLKWVSHQSDKISEDLKLAHYAIWTEDWVIEILSSAEPKVEFFDIKSE